MGEGVLIVWGRVVAITYYCSQLQFSVVVRQRAADLCGGGERLGRRGS